MGQKKWPWKSIYKFKIILYNMIFIYQNSISKDFPHNVLRYLYLKNCWKHVTLLIFEVNFIVKILTVISYKLPPKSGNTIERYIKKMTMKKFYRVSLFWGQFLSNFSPPCTRGFQNRNSPACNSPVCNRC